MADDTKLAISVFGKSIAVEGVLGIVIVVLLCLSGSLGYMLYDLSTAASQAVRAAADVQKQTVVEHRAIMLALERIQGDQGTLEEGVRRVDSSVKTQNYILLSETDEKAKIKRKLQMPKELRELLSDR